MWKSFVASFGAFVLNGEVHKMGVDLEEDEISPTAVECVGNIEDLIKL